MGTIHQRNQEFDEYLDSKGSYVIEGLSFFPSDILFTQDPDGYKAALEDWISSVREELIQRTFDTLNYGSNNDRFSRLANAINKGRVVPFIGAGLSIPCNKPGWKEFLLDLAENKARVDACALNIRLENGEFEEVAEELIEAIGMEWFDEAIENTFGGECQHKGTVLLLPRLVNNTVITTNFDTVLEDVFGRFNCSFQEVVVGSRESGYLNYLVEGNRRALLKLHGHVHEKPTRVLTKQEYETAYGTPEIDFEKPLPQVLRHVYISHCLLFLGCSLHRDRTVKLFEIVKTNMEQGLSPRHWAILERPNDDEGIVEREKFLTERNIFPIWYPAGEHDIVEGLLLLLIGQITS